MISCQAGDVPGAEIRQKIGSMFAPLPLTENKHAAPKRGALSGPQDATKGGATVVIFWQSLNENGLSLASSSREVR